MCGAVQLYALILDVLDIDNYEHEQPNRRSSLQGGTSEDSSTTNTTGANIQPAGSNSSLHTTGLQISHIPKVYRIDFSPSFQISSWQVYGRIIIIDFIDFIVTKLPFC